MAPNDIEWITSRKNPRVQRIKKLLINGQFRNLQKSFVLEGVRLVETAIKSGWHISEIYFDEQLNRRGKALIDDVLCANTARFVVSESVLSEITDTDTPQGIVAVLIQRGLPIRSNPSFFLVLDAIRDPGNVGTILRTASAAGVDAVLISPDTADSFSPKVLRAGMGAQLNLPIRELDWPQIGRTVHDIKSMRVYLADTQKGINLWQVDLSVPVAIIVSNEATGPSEQARRLADEIITIPMPGMCDSLNAAVAASLLIYETLRQRSKASRHVISG